MAFGFSAGLSLSDAAIHGRKRRLPPLPFGFVFVIDADGAYLVDTDGAYLIVAL